MNTKDDYLTTAQDPAKRRAWVKYQLHLQGRSMARIAASAGVERCTLYWVFKRPYPRMEQVIATALDLTPQQLFPERYGPDGLPNRPVGRPRKSTNKDTAKSPKRQVKRATTAQEKSA